jgi:hypothetical protein
MVFNVTLFVLIIRCFSGVFVTIKSQKRPLFADFSVTLAGALLISEITGMHRICDFNVTLFVTLFFILSLYYIVY